MESYYKFTIQNNSPLLSTVISVLNKQINYQNKEDNHNQDQDEYDSQNENGNQDQDAIENGQNNHDNQDSKSQAWFLFIMQNQAGFDMTKILSNPQFSLQKTIKSLNNKNQEQFLKYKNELSIIAHGFSLTHKENKQVISKMNKDKQNQIYENEKLNMIIKYQISSEKYYTQKLQSPYLPGAMSGITIGIGYDLGQCSIKQFQQNWKNKLSHDNYKILQKCIGLKQNEAKMFMQSNKQELKKIKISLKAAKQVFNNTLKKFQGRIQKKYPKLKQNYPNTYNSLVSMYYNRGFATQKQSRRQIKMIDQVLSQKQKTSQSIPKFVAKQLQSMCRLWQNDPKLIGLIKRRQQQAENCMRDLQINQ